MTQIGMRERRGSAITVLGGLAWAEAAGDEVPGAAAGRPHGMHRRRGRER